MQPILFTLTVPFVDRAFAVPSYGLFLTLGFLLAFVMGHRRGLRHGYDPDVLINLYIVIFLCGMAGARLTQILVNWKSFTANPWPYFQLWGGGGVFYGGLLGAIAGCGVYGRIAGIPWGLMADEAAPCVALGHLLGRIGCLLNGCCYGLPSTVSWACAFGKDPALRHPTQAYEALGLSVIVIVLYRLVRRPHRAWSVAILYCFLYGMLRLVIERYRGDDRGATLFGLLSVSQFISLGFLATAAIGWSIVRRQAWPGPPDETPPEPRAAPEA